jgi:hypothetical protein
MDTMALAVALSKIRNDPPLFADDAATIAGPDADESRNLAKSVSVE